MPGGNRLDFSSRSVAMAPSLCGRSTRESSLGAHSLRGNERAPAREAFHASQAQHSYYDSQMTSDSPPSKRHAESYYDSQMTTDSSGAYDSQSQCMTLSQGESQEMRSTFSANGKRGSSMRPPLSGSGAYSQSPTVSAYINSVNKVYDKMRSMGKVSMSTLGHETGSVCSGGDLGSVVSALRQRPAANDQMKQELKDHITQSFTKLEGMLQAHVLLHEEDRQRMAALQAEVVKLNDLVTTQFQGAKEDFSAFGERMTSKLDDAALTTRPAVSIKDAWTQSVAIPQPACQNVNVQTPKAFKFGKQPKHADMGQTDEEDEIDLFTDPFAQRLEDQAFKRQKKICAALLHKKPISAKASLVMQQTKL